MVEGIFIGSRRYNAGENSFTFLIPTKTRFPIGGECVTCLGPKFTKLHRETFDSRDHLVVLEALAKMCVPASVKQAIFSQFLFLIFELRGVRKHLTAILKVSRKQNSLNPMGPVIRCFLMLGAVYYLIIPPPFYFCRAQSERDSSYAVTDDPSEIRRHYAASAGSTAAQCWEVGLEDLQPFSNPDSALRDAIKYLANTEDW